MGRSSREGREGVAALVNQKQRRGQRERERERGRVGDFSRREKTFTRIFI